jgi:cell division protein FtsI/penicillin-binding protein 2
LGYMSKRGAGVGTESPGFVPKLPWSHSQTHASLSFGHELSVNLWQHAEALSTILRGGIRRPLRMLRQVNWEEQSMDLVLEDGKRVFRRETCATVRTMMAEGATNGTGRHLSGAEKKLGTPIELLSKTGTTEKEQGVMCLHKELRRNALNSKLKGGSKHPDFISFKSLAGTPREHNDSCYTSSICLVGRVEGEQREVMVVIVVEEPRKDKRFGSDVAGPAAISVLKDALGLTRSGTCVVERNSVVPDYGYESAGSVQDEPWRLRPVEASAEVDGADSVEYTR